MQRDKEDVAAKMREKQRLGRGGIMLAKEKKNHHTTCVCNLTMGHVTADERKAADAAAAAKK